jgi:hypothetical protein
MFKSLCNILTPPTTQKNIMCRWGSVYITIKHLSYTFYVQPFSDPFKLQDFRKKKLLRYTCATLSASPWEGEIF